MPDRRGANLFEHLPEEIIDKILTQLPPKDVGRCRVVSTAWRSITSTPEFMLEHHRHQPSLPIINGDGRPASLVVIRGTGSCRASNQQLWPFVPGFQHRSKSDLHASCDGLLVIRHLTRYYICNPVTREHAFLPQLRQGFFNNIIGFYRHHPTGEYRVLWVSMSHDLSKSSLHALTVGSKEPRHVAVTMPGVSLPFREHKLLMEICPLSSSPPPVHHRGSLHWFPYGGCPILGDGGDDIIVFDTEAESFRRMRGPTQLCSNRKLFEMKGELAFWGSPAPGYREIDVWVMQDYEAKIWDFKYRIDPSTVEVSRQLYLASSKRKTKAPLDSTVRWFNDMVVLNEHELLIKFNNKLVFRYDIGGKFLGIVNLGKRQYCMFLTQHRLQESIIPIPSHWRQGEDEEPPFCTGHV
ncbi:F-box protein At5g49610-like [Lolium rigidum]|uniref:F-box protein At5g49610-like n=1 Tax=Lolium rigidum TaxID=89674 RepID=UPI001F5DC011|nr:F-box protein At5g49610-like [Lolium rigidum]